MRLCEKLLWKMNRDVLNFYWDVINKIFIPWHELKIMSTMWTEFCRYKQKEFFLKIAYYNKWAIASWFLTAMSSAKGLSLDSNFFQDVMMRQKPGYYRTSKLEILYPQFQNYLNRKTRFSLRLVFLWVWIVLPEENKIIGLK